jgi:dTDP-glucose 4,6-dehydratase
LEASRLNNVPLFLHLSTDEVYGEIAAGSFNEKSILNPSNPYSGSKAAAEMIVNSYRHSFDMPIITLRGNNVFGKRQFPEKIIPKFCMQLLTGNKLSLHGDGSNMRNYLAAEDLALAMVLLLEKGIPGETYNIGSDEEYTNATLAQMICDIFDVDIKKSVEFVKDRPFNDSRYSINCAKIHSLGWKPKRRLKDTLKEVVTWYVNNKMRYESLFERNEA